MPSRLGSQPFSGWPEALPRSAGHLPRLSLQGCPWWLAVLFLGTRGHCFLKTPASAPASAEVILPVTVTPMGYTGSDPQPLVLSWLLASSACPHTFPNVWLLCQPPFSLPSTDMMMGPNGPRLPLSPGRFLGCFGGPDWAKNEGQEPTSGSQVLTRPSYTCSEQQAHVYS